MKKLLLILCLIASSILYAQSNLPPCNGDYWNNCFGSYTFPIGDKFAGDKYVGEVRDNKWHGQGTYTFADGRQYIGQWKDNTRNGQGTLSWPNGDKYIGEYKDGQRNGQGTLTFADGRQYIGQWKDGKFDGFGTLYHADGSIKQQGLWRDDKFVQAQTPPSVTPPVVPKQPVIVPVTPNPPVIAPVTPKPSVNNAQDIKRQKCIRLGLVPGSVDFQQCMK